jgi:hypothetical protein
LTLSGAGVVIGFALAIGRGGFASTSGKDSAGGGTTDADAGGALGGEGVGVNT